MIIQITYTDDNRRIFREKGGLDCLIACYEKYGNLAKDVISCLANAVGDVGIEYHDFYSLLYWLLLLFLYSFIVIAETSAEFLLGKRFIRTVVDLTFEKISDHEFCQKASYLLYLTSESLTFILQIYEFFSDIRRFELITALLLEYSSDEKICYSTLAIFSKLLIQEWDKVKIGKMAEDSLKAALESGILDIIQDLVDKSKDDSLVSLCGVVFQLLYHRSKI